MIKKYCTLSLLSVMLAFLFFSYHNEWIIFNFNEKKPLFIPQKQSQKKNFELIFLQNDTWKTETITILAGSEIEAIILQLINRWLHLLYEEKVIKKKTVLQAVLLNYNAQELFLSFERLPWHKEMSTFQKWMIIEGILKTIKKAEPSIKKVRFLLNHQPMVDNHLDFTNAWPIEGFI